MQDQPKSNLNDPYSRVDYRRFVAWPERIRREAPFLLRSLETAPSRSVLDLGCGSGEHSRFLAREGFRAVGLDRSEAMLEQARERPLPSNLQFVLGEAQQAERLVEGAFGAAICLGNTLPHLKERADLENAFRGLSILLEPRGVLLFQILNYERFSIGEASSLPLNFRREQNRPGWIVFLRLMERRPGGQVRFCPSTLRFDPQAEAPLQVVKSRIVDLRGWTLDDLRPLLQANGFEVELVQGDMQTGPFDSAQSQDLVVVARRKAQAAGKAGEG